MRKQQVLNEVEEEFHPELPEPTVEKYEQTADACFGRGDINRAFLYYNKALGIDGDNDRLIHKIGLLWLKKKKYAEAEKVIEYALSLNSQPALYHQSLGQALFGGLKIDQAEQSFRTALAKDDNLVSSHVYMGLLHGGRGEYEQAAACYEKALALDPRNIAALNNLALTRLAMGRQEEALDIFEQLGRLYPENKKVFNNMGLLYCRLNKYEQAMGSFKMGTLDEATAYNNLGYGLLYHQRYQEAQQAFEKAVGLNPKYYEKADNNLKTVEKVIGR